MIVVCDPFFLKTIDCRVRLRYARICHRIWYNGRIGTDEIGPRMYNSYRKSDRFKTTRDMFYFYRLAKRLGCLIKRLKKRGY